MRYPDDFLNRILCGDNVEMMSQIPNDTIHLTVTSPPYDDIREYHGYSFRFEDVARELYRVTVDGGVVVWIVGDGTVNGGETLTSFRQGLFFQSLGFKMHDTMIYQKSAFANPSSNRYHQIWEYMFVLVKGDLRTFHPIKDKPNDVRNTFGKARRDKHGSMLNSENKSRLKLMPYGMRFNIWRYITGRGNMTADPEAYAHPAIFPEALARDHILSWSNEGDVVLDPFNGSGTSTKMAKTYGRNFIGIDISEEYCKIARQRLTTVGYIISKKTDLLAFQ